MLDINKIKEKYPKAYNELFNYYSSQVSNLRGLPGVQEMIKEEQMKALTEASIAMLFKNPANTRQLYDFFDSKEFFIDINRFLGDDSQNCFYFAIDETSYEFAYSTRQQAEEAAFNECFSQLNDLL